MILSVLSRLVFALFRVEGHGKLNPHYVQGLALYETDI
jgi:hypothetical protein